MRKYTIALVALFTMCSAKAYAIPEPTYASAIKKMSTGQAQGTGTRVIKLVRHASADPNANTIVSGDALRYSTVSDDGVTVAPTLVSADTAFAGIACTSIQSSDSSSGTSAQDDGGRRNWGWITIHGPATANVRAGGTSHSAGDPFITSSDASRITGMQAGTGQPTSVTLAQSAGKGGFFFSASAASDTTAEVFVMAE